MFDDVSFRYGNAEGGHAEPHQLHGEARRDDGLHRRDGRGQVDARQPDPALLRRDRRRGALNGVDVRDVRQAELREQIGYVPQKGVLFSGTIASNVRYGREDADEQAVLEALDCAQASEFVSELPGGTENPIAQGGTNVSGGRSSALRSRGRWCAKRRSISSTTAFPRSTSGPTQSCAARSRRSQRIRSC